jgi:DNA polymerase III subunit epsilon
VLDQPLVFLDLETTGASAVHDRVIEIGLIEVEGGCVTEWSSLVDPGRRIPAGIQAFTGITDVMVEAAPAFSEIAERLRTRLEGKLLIAHNARFDYGFLRSEFRRAGFRYASRVLCTVQLSRSLYPRERHHNLDALMARHGIACQARHRGLDDARVLWSLLRLWRRCFDQTRLSAAMESLIRTPVTPAGLPDGLLDEIPDAPGVYVLRGPDDAVLYVGKSRNMHAGVSAHFTSGPHGSRNGKLSRETTRVEWVAVPGRLRAEIEEARLVRDLAPLYNRNSHRSSAWYAWRWHAQSLLVAPRLVKLDDVATADCDGLYGVFGSRPAALKALRDIAEMHQLCLTVLGLEPGDGPCHGRWERRCRGACIGKETRERHALRLGTALVGLRMKPWPFNGPIGIREKGSDQLIVLDAWRYLGTARSERDLADLTDSGEAPAFDRGTYKMLSRYLMNGRRGYQLVELPAEKRGS